jgi:hypothetical protein
LADEGIFEKIRLTQIIRYGYAGFLAAGIAAFLAPAEVKPGIEAAGHVVAPLVVFAIGACIYVLYRYVLGELMIFPLVHYIHYLVDTQLFGKAEARSPITFLARQGVRLGQRRNAYTDIRRGVFKDAERTRLDLDHTEIAVLYLTAVEFAGAWIYLAASRSGSAASGWFFAVTAVLVGIAAIIADIKQHVYEFQLLQRPVMLADLSKMLQDNGYTQSL